MSDEKLVNIFYIQNGNSVSTSSATSTNSGVKAVAAFAVGIMLTQAFSNAGTDQMVRVIKEACEKGASSVEIGGKFDMPNGLSHEYHAKVEFESNHASGAVSMDR